MKLDGQSLRRSTRQGAENGDPRRVMPVRPRAQLAARAGLWSLVGLGAVGGVVGLVRPAGQGAAGATQATAPASMPAEVGGFAELATTTWLEADARAAGLLEIDADGASGRNGAGVANSDGDGSETPEPGGRATVGGAVDEAGADRTADTDADPDPALQRLFAVDPSARGDDTGVRRATDVATVGGRRIGPGYWAVTVAASVQELDAEQRWRAAGTWFVELGVVEDDAGALVAVSEPALVPAPRRPTAPPEPVGGGLRTPSSDEEELAGTVQGFLSAMLAGDGDVSRYLAPEATVAAVVSPPPFDEVALREWAVTPVSDREVLARVAARGVSPVGVPRTVSYELRLVQRAGRWEVTAMSGAPTLLDTSLADNAAPAATSQAPATAAPGTDGPAPQTPTDQTPTDDTSGETPRSTVPAADPRAVPRAPSTTLPVASEPGA